MNYYRGCRVVVPATSPALFLGEVKAHLRQIHSDDDALILGLVDAAADYVESITSQALVSRTVRAVFDKFDNVIRLPLWPVVDIVSVEYLWGGAWNSVASTDWRLSLDSCPALLMPATQKSWPVTDNCLSSLRIDFICGWGSSPNIPASMRQAMLLWVEQAYDADKDYSSTIQALLDPHRLRWI